MQNTFLDCVKWLQHSHRICFDWH